MILLDRWMPEYDEKARYSIRIAAPPARVYEALLAADFRRLGLVRALMGIRLIPSLLRAPAATWRGMRRRRRPAPRPTARMPSSSRGSLTDLTRSGFVLLEEAPPREIVLGITGRFWKPAAEIVAVPPERFREALPAGLAQAAWNFEIAESPCGSALMTETRVRCADAATRRRFRLYWRLVAPGSGLIRRAILREVRREALGAGRAI
jgi:hypothetical protein